MRYRITVIVAMVAIAMLVSGCCSACNIFTPDPDLQRVLFAEDYHYDNNSTTIVGGWSSIGSNASIVDPGLAFYSWYGAFQDGEWYIFMGSGYFKYVKMATENGGRGGIYRAGRFSTDGAGLMLFEINESWYPDSNLSWNKPAYRSQKIDDERLTYEILDNKTLIIHGVAGNDTYHRLLVG